jgi:hypothetical protein
MEPLILLVSFLMNLILIDICFLIFTVSNLVCMRSEGTPNSFCVTEHRRDAARAEESVVLSYGTELIGMQRDWNEELQSCREFPHGNPQERFFSYSNYFHL